MNSIIHNCLRHVVPQFRLDLHHGWHGIAHWSRVWKHARFLCQELGVDPTVPCHFAFLHDSQRFDEGIDSSHGVRAASFAERLYLDGKLDLTAEQMGLLVVAMSLHSNGHTKADPIIQICWDADRLDLGRVGIRPDPRYLCTSVAKRPEVIQRAWELSTR